MESTSLTPAERIERTILSLRNQRVILDTDLATLYGVTTKALNQAVQRNVDRFPDDFMFQLTEAEKQEVVTNCDHLSKLKFSPYLPYAFTEHGAIMVATILNKPVAVQASIQVVRTFIQLRRMLSNQKTIAKKLEALERNYDHQFKLVFDTLNRLLAPPVKQKKIGFGEKN